MARSRDIPRTRGAAGSTIGTRTPGRARADSLTESVSLWFRLLSCHSVILAKLRRELEDRITLARFDLLASLNREDGQTLASLSRALLVTAGNLTGLVDRAARDGVVERRADPNDRRLARVWLTVRGRALIRDLLPAHDEHVHELLRGLPPQDRHELRRLLGGLREHLTVAPVAPVAPPAAYRRTKTAERMRTA